MAWAVWKQYYVHGAARNPLQEAFYFQFDVFEEQVRKYMSSYGYSIQAWQAFIMNGFMNTMKFEIWFKSFLSKKKTDFLCLVFSDQTKT